MFAYYFLTAVRGLKQHFGLTVLMVLAIGFGIGASTTTYAVFRAASGDPIPWKSAQLFVPRIDPWGPAHAIRRRGEPPDALTYLDATRLMQDHRAHYQSAIYAITPLVTPDDSQRHPFDITGHAVYSEFFPMLDVPFRYGGGWNAQDDTQHAAVVVISDKLNRQLFEGENSVGKTLNLAGKDYRILGVLGHWNPQPRFYDIMDTETGGFSGQSDDVFVPFNTAIEAPIENDGFTMCAEAPPAPTFAGQLKSSCVWIAYLAQLDTPAQATAYRNYLSHYAQDQQQAGRFGWAPNVRLRDLNDWLDYHHVVPGDIQLSLLVALGLLVVCLVNAVGVLLGKFLHRDAEISIRRTLGAPRSAIYLPCFIEAGLIGLAGGAVGIALTWLGLYVLDWLLPHDIAALVHLDLPLLLAALTAAVIGTWLAALYPTLRIARTSLIGGAPTSRKPHRLELPPAFSVLHRHAISVSLIVLQIALSLAIVANALFIIGQRIEHVRVATGMDEQNLFLVSQQWVGFSDTESPAMQSKLDNLQQADLDVLRNLPDVAAATPVSSLPLLGNSSNVYLNTQPMQQHGEAFAGLYNGDETTLTTLGMHLIAGRNFSANEVRRDDASRPVIMLTQALSSKLFPGGDALGKTVYLNGGNAPSIITGIVERLRVASDSGQEASSPWYSVITPTRLPAVATLYAVRAKPGRLAAAMKATMPALYASDPLRLMDADSVTPYTETRAKAFRAEIGTVMLMGLISILLLAVTGTGVASLSHSWVRERRRQIGIRRALGARRIDILRHFQSENLAIVSSGIVIGLILAVILNKLLMSYFEANALPLIYVLSGVAIVIVLGQCAVYVPARQASRISPALATRSV